METDSGQRAMSKRREGAKERLSRRLRAEARIRLQLCRDAVRIASHRGGDGCRRAHTDASTQTASVDEPPASLVALVPVPEHVASTVTLVTPDPVIEDVAPAPTVSFNPVIDHVTSAPSLSSTAPAPVIEFVTFALAHPVIEYVASSPVIPHISLAPTATFAAPSQQFSPVATMADQIVGIPALSIATEMEMAKVFCAARVPMIELVTPTPVLERITSAPVTTQFSPAFTMTADTKCTIREPFVEGVKASSQERLPQRTNDQIVGIPVSSIAEVPGVPCAAPVGPQIGDLGFD